MLNYFCFKIYPLYLVKCIKESIIYLTFFLFVQNELMYQIKNKLHLHSC